MKPSEELRAARALIEVPERWCQNKLALTPEGEEVDADHPSSVKWCAAGALMHGQGEFFPAWNFLNEAIDVHPVSEDDEEAFITFNNTHSHAEVIGMFDRAIELAEAAGQ